MALSHDTDFTPKSNLNIQGNDFSLNQELTENKDGMFV